MMTKVKPPTVFWIVAIAAVIWNGLGVAAYLSEVTMSADARAALSAAERSLYDARPFWVGIAFAVSVFAGLAGSILLLIRKALATTFLIISFAKDALP